MTKPRHSATWGLWSLVPALVLACAESPGKQTGSVAEAAAVAGSVSAGDTASAEQVIDSVVTAFIPAEGGALELPRVASIRFPHGAFSSAQRVSVRITGEPGTSGGRWKYYLLGGGPRPGNAADSGEQEPPPVPYDVRISGDVGPATPFQVLLWVPDSYLTTVPSGYVPRVFAELESGGPDELHSYYEEVPSSFDPQTGQLETEVWADTGKWSRRDGRFEVILLIGSRPDV